ncbi:hypothetical protein [Acinetobacter larvae]|uniref:Uncharacterized protein n=1 Tax=Acinetobacter larvae TaxID=1789224 RepID=A0A1B2M050_9GAMM|nr:hypothetical protein [Acinetobacter larvae]AOA58558.1 hypothetical protein BFG52_09470 [Acinetobacter larvae]
MNKDFQAMQYIVDDNIADTMHWLLQHQDCFDELCFDVHSQQLRVIHANGTDIIREGMYLNAGYGLLITS